MGKLQNSLTAGAVYLTAIALLYGFTASVAKTSAHWGSGFAGRETIDVMSDAASLPGGGSRHGGFGRYTEDTKGYGPSVMPKTRTKTYVKGHRA